MKKQNAVSEHRISQLIDVQSRQQHVIQELKNKVDALERDRIWPNLIISGIRETEEENSMTVVKNFFKEILGLVHDIHMKKAFRIGKGKNRAIKVILSNPGDKGLIYANVKKLQGKKGVNEKPYRIEDQLLPAEREERKRVREFKWRNKQSTAEQVAMSVQRGKLVVEGRTYQPPIWEPTAKEVMNLSAKEIEELDQLNIVKGKEVIQDSSTFQGYVCDVTTFQEVNHVYQYVKLRNMEARHIICACKIPGTKVMETIGYCDSDEYGAGAKLMTYIDSAKMKNRAIYRAKARWSAYRTSMIRMHDQCSQICSQQQTLQ